MRQLGEWPYHPTTRSRFADGGLAREWLARYPRIFDDLDLSQVLTQPTKHFHEWLAAVLVFESTGHLSLVEKYQFGKHRRKQNVMRRLMTPDMFDWLTKAPRPCQGPDLLAYDPASSDWYFIEVKGPRDRLRSVQREYFEDIERFTGRPVYSVRLREVNSG